MAEKDVVRVTSLADTTTTTTTTTNLKRKLGDLDEPTSAVADVAASDLSEFNAADNIIVGNVDDDSSKRLRLDELVIENGHKPEGENGHTKENAELGADVENVEPEADVVNVEPEADVENAEPGTSVEDAETAIEGQTDDDESAQETDTVKQNEDQPLPEVELKGDAQIGNSKDIDAQNFISGEVQPDSIEKISGDETHKSASEVTAAGELSSAGQHPDSGSKSISRKIEIPNNKVGVLIGKSGDTIRFLQINSGAKIQITRDADADRHAATRTVELVGTSESVNKAEMIIKDVIAEADTGGSPALVARGVTASLTTGSTEVELPVPGDKVGIIIGRGGDTIKGLQARSGARIQLIPQSVPGEQSKDKKVKITGDKKQVEVAKELIMEVMNQLPGRPSQFSGNNYNQQSYPPRGPRGAPQWGNRGPPNQRGPYSSQSQQYPAKSYGNHPYQGPPRSNFGSGWEHRPPSHRLPQSGGYEYYGQGGGHAASASAPRSAHMTGHASGPSMAPPHSQGNHNYGQPRGADYTHPSPYSQTAPPAQNYGHGYGDPKYNAQAPVQQPPYGGQGYAPPQQGYAPPQQGYAPQQQYSRPPTYGMPAQGGPQGGYAPLTASQPVDTPYQAPVSGHTPYQAPVSGHTQPHQQYPYAPGPTTQPPYGAVPMTNDAYSQPQQAAGYAQPGAQAQPVPAYGQQPGGYTQSTAPGAYGYQGQMDPSAYGYQGQADPSAAYSSAPAAAQAAYAQPVATQPGYDQTAPTGAYPSAAAPAAQPQPGYPQYDASQQMYAAPR